jgi:peptidoglycan/xylan/chitin deacetylase (PgdA/CDA1 family)
MKLRSRLRIWRNGTRKSLILLLHRKTVVRLEPKTIVSFTFDDFPRSAYLRAGAILRDHNAYGTYYASLGRMNTEGEWGPYFTDRDLRNLIAGGHELGCHTFDHLRCCSTPLAMYRDNVARNQLALNTLLPDYTLRHFAYPFGEITLAAKRTLNQHFITCRGIFGGINSRWLDLNLLRANRLYSSTVTFHQIDRLIQENARKKGWLIFYTHDVCEEPSPFGCTPQYFEVVVKWAIESGAAILTISQALSHCNVTAVSRCP